MAKKKNIDPKVLQLRRSIVDKFKFDQSNPHPELAKSKQKRVPSRREKRKLAKQVKKARRIAHATKQPLDNLYAEILHKKKSNAKVKPVLTDEELKEKQIEMKRKKIEEKKETRRQEMQQFIEEDEKEIKMYSKRLKLNKRKSNTLPQSFVDEGLSYLLELCDTTKRQKVIENEASGDEVDSFDDDDQPKSDSEGDESLPLKKIKKNIPSEGSSTQKHVRFADEGKKLTIDEEETLTDDEIESENESENSNDDDENELTEDIYGRVKDKKGNIVKQTLKQTESSQETTAKSVVQRNVLTKLFKSLINRLSEATVQSAVIKVQECYQMYSRNDVKEVLSETIFQSCIRNERVPDRLLLEQSLLLALIHSKISSEITSYFVENLALKLKYFRFNLSENNTEDKNLDNLSAMLAHLFSLKVIQSKLVFEILNYFLSTFVEKDIELILLICQTVGNSLRKDNQAEFKLFFENVAVKSTSKEVSSLNNQSRVKYMLETLKTLKSGDVKVSNYDPTFAEHCLKLLRGTMAGKALESPLPMGLQDLWSASKNGRWWIVGSAVVVAPVSTNSSSTTDMVVGSESSSKMQFSDVILKLAKKNRMNTDLRRNVFCIMMSSEDYLDAFEKLTKLSLKDQQEREIIHIALHCCLKEKSFNPFYSYLVQRFCSDQPRFTLTTQFALWDKFKILDELNSTEIENLALFLSHLIANKVLPLTVLKAVDFGQIDENVQKFLTILFTKFLTDATDENLRSIFANCLIKKKFQSFSEGVKIFLHHIFLKRIVREKDQIQLSKRISMIDKFFYYSLDNSAL